METPVVMAFWPIAGTNIFSINYQQKSVGVVQYFVRHSVCFKSGNKVDVLEHIFAFVKWKKAHPNHNFYGRSATVCEDIFESSSICSFLPVQRSACLAAHSVLKISVGNVEESAFVACPIPIKFLL